MMTVERKRPPVDLKSWFFQKLNAAKKERLLSEDEQTFKALYSVLEVMEVRGEKVIPLDEHNMVNLYVRSSETGTNKITATIDFLLLAGALHMLCHLKSAGDLYDNVIEENGRRLKVLTLGGEDFIKLAKQLNDMARADFYSRVCATFMGSVLVN